tara:strand:- start:166 stop:543 length:378 start_codon:yes stop_codon:yes gene_type:complete
MKRLLTLLFSICLLFATAQTSTFITNKNTTSILKVKEHSKVPHHIKFVKGEQIMLGNMDAWLKEFYELEGFSLKIIDSKVDNLGFTHFRYLQKLNGYPIELSRYNVHVKDGFVLSMNGVLFSNLI